MQQDINARGFDRDFLRYRVQYLKEIYKEGHYQPVTLNTQAMHRTRPIRGLTGYRFRWNPKYSNNRERSTHWTKS